ncbi:hypothetical protein ABBQ32_007059 [Trebouxia sp. C0010 RCD-2024]
MVYVRVQSCCAVPCRYALLPPYSTPWGVKLRAHHDSNTTLMPDPASLHTTTVGTAVASAVLRAFEGLPKTGKPQVHEHTVLAGFVVSRKEEASMEYHVVALGTGTKCLGAQKRTCQGDLINDSHAEVIAKRALQVWLYGELDAALSQVCSTSSEGPIGGLPTPSIISVNSEGQFELCNGVQLHMFISQPPCGDACVIDSNLQPASRLPRPESSAHAADMQQNQLPQKDIDSSGEGSSGTRVSQTRDNSWHTTHTSSDGQGLPSGPLFTRMHLTASESSAPPTLRGPEAHGRGWAIYAESLEGGILHCP